MNRIFTFAIWFFVYLLIASPANARPPSSIQVFTMIIDNQLSPESPDPYSVKQANGKHHFPNQVKTINYYLQLNRTLSTQLKIIRCFPPISPKTVDNATFSSLKLL